MPFCSSSLLPPRLLLLPFLDVEHSYISYVCFPSHYEPVDCEVSEKSAASRVIKGKVEKIKVHAGRKEYPASHLEPMLLNSRTEKEANSEQRISLAVRSSDRMGQSSLID